MCEPSIEVPTRHGASGVEPSTQVRSVNGIVAAALAAFVFLYSVNVACVIVPWLSYSVPGATNLAVLTFTTGASFYCYLFCVLRDPGKVPDEWQPDSEEEAAVLEVKRKGGARFCQKCQRHKPPRSHHCRVCQRCVLRMDHHCPYTNNCVGHTNYRAFLVFLVWANAALLHTLGLIAAHTLHLLHTAQQQRFVRAGPQAVAVALHEEGLQSVWVWAMLQIAAFLLALPLFIGLLMLLGWHVHLVMHNQTTIEHMEGVTARVKGMPAESHPYDLGPYHNITQILGDSFGTSLCPPCAPTEGGTSFVTVWDMGKLGIS
ncbi:hypothetical protein FOA52_015985 [Chlamydomonas sp. UWO 241]|nr:hypothetical protein FOA52_015985 [Chlamydomonas sp. UWO 241]